MGFPSDGDRHLGDRGDHSWEPEREQFLDALEKEPVARISAATLVEVGVVLARKRMEGGESRLQRLIAAAPISVEPLTAEQSATARRAFRAFGKGRHPAQLNFGDTFSYALAMHLSEPLLFKGNDFSQTDVTPAV